MKRVLLTLLLAFPIPAAGSRSQPNSHATPSPDGTRLLVMVTPPPCAKDDLAPPFILPDGREVIIRETFKKSGVYDAKTLKPLWQWGWFEWEWNLLYSDDFKHVVRRNQDGFHDGFALAFYDDGRLVRWYECADLLTGLCHHEFLHFTTGNWHTQWYDDFRLNVDGTVQLSTMRRVLHVRTWRLDLEWQEFYTFDLADGAIAEQRVVGRWRVWAYGVMALLPVLLVPLALRAVRALWRRWDANSRRRGFPVELSAP